MFAESLVILGEILSGPVAFFGFMSLMILFISAAVACRKSKVLTFKFVWFSILVMLVCFFTLFDYVFDCVRIF